jgi:hypothetical protein
MPKPFFRVPGTKAEKTDISGAGGNKLFMKDKKLTPYFIVI